MITILSNARLLDCVGEEPLEDATVIIEKTEIKDLYTGYRVLPEGRIIDVKGMTILPGLTDAHIHPALTGLVISEGFKEPPIIIAMKIRNNLERILIGGCTTIRDMGGANFALKQAVDEGLISGPRILISNHPICQTGGVWDWSNRGDFTGLPKDDRLVSIGRIADGIDEVRKATREQFRAGASHIKTFS
ncbi:MAG: amidohydrolase family protein [Desulfobacteraceae bacterium]|nr:amidohydrolase family protein [Desulfobacteraceae bacterium]